MSSCDVLNCLFLLDVQNEIQLLSRLFCNSFLVCLLHFLLTNALLFKRVEKCQAILEHLITFRSSISTGKLEQLLSLLCVLFFQFPEVERMVYAA